MYIGVACIFVTLYVMFVIYTILGLILNVYQGSSIIHCFFSKHKCIEKSPLFDYWIDFISTLWFDGVVSANLRPVPLYSAKQ